MVLNCEIPFVTKIHARRRQQLKIQKIVEIQIVIIGFK